MIGPTGFFCFTHLVRVTPEIEYRYAFAYKPPGPMLRGALDELMVTVCKGPQVPDVVVVVSLSEELGTDLLAEMQSDTASLAQQRLKARIPLVHAKLELATGKARMTLLDNSFKRRTAEMRRVVEAGVQSWITAGLRAVFNPDEVILRAPPGYAYQKPSGARSEFFLKPDLALKSSAAVSFVSLGLFHKLFSGRIDGFSELQTVFVDTMAIAPVAYGLRELLTLFGFERAFYIESFHSYGGFEGVRKPLPGTSLCLISASSSMTLHKQWMAHKEVSPQDVVTIVTLTSAEQFKDGALLAIDAPVDTSSAGPLQLSIRIKGESFLPEQEAAKKVLLNEAQHRSDSEVRHFYQFSGKGVFDTYRRPSHTGSRPRALFVDGASLIKQREFQDWLQQHLVQSVKAATRLVVCQDDMPSRTLAHHVQTFCTSNLAMPKLRLVSAHELPTTRLEAQDGVIVCAAVIGKGSQLLEISRTLRDKHVGPRLYLVGYQVADTRGELKALESNLKHSKVVPHEVARFGTAAIGTQLEASFKVEVETYYSPSRALSRLPTLLRQRGQLLGTTSGVGKLALLPHGSKVKSLMPLRPGFAFWPKEFDAQPCHAEVLATIAVLLQRAREFVKLPDEHRLATPTYRHVMLDPENFTRFNDGVIQAALLRCAYPAELDYRGDHAASDFMKAVILRALSRAEQEAGEGTLEFLLALAQERLMLSDGHFSEVVSAALEPRGRPPLLQSAIRFVLDSHGKTAQRRRRNLPF